MLFISPDVFVKRSLAYSMCICGNANKCEIAIL